MSTQKPDGDKSRLRRTHLGLRRNVENKVERGPDAGVMAPGRRGPSPHVPVEGRRGPRTRSPFSLHPKSPLGAGGERIGEMDGATPSAYPARARDQGAAEGFGQRPPRPSTRVPGAHKRPLRSAARSETQHPSSALSVEEETPKLHKILAEIGLGSRREMEELIIAGRITVNMEPAHIGQRVGPHEQVRINGELIKRKLVAPPIRVLMYHKPMGELVSYNDPEGRPLVFAHLPSITNGKWVAIGRLDFNTEGLLLFTNSGTLANQMMHPRYEIEREYHVRILGSVDKETEAKLINGVELEDGPAQFHSFKKSQDHEGTGTNQWYEVVLKEGRNREVRRMFEAVGLTVNRLVRVRYGNMVLPRNLRRGEWRELEPTQLAQLQEEVGMKPTEVRAPRARARPALGAKGAGAIKSNKPPLHSRGAHLSASPFGAGNRSSLGGRKPVHLASPHATSAPVARDRKPVEGRGKRQPDPLQTSVSFLAKRGRMR